MRLHMHVVRSELARNISERNVSQVVAAHTACSLHEHAAILRYSLQAERVGYAIAHDSMSQLPAPRDS